MELLSKQMSEVIFIYAYILLHMNASMRVSGIHLVSKLIFIITMMIELRLFMNTPNVSLYKHTYVYLYAYVHICMHTYVHVSIINIHMSIYVQIYTYKRIAICQCIEENVVQASMCVYYKVYIIKYINFTATKYISRINISTKIILHVKLKICIDIDGDMYMYVDVNFNTYIEIYRQIYLFTNTELVGRTFCW